MSREPYEKPAVTETTELQVAEDLLTAAQRLSNLIEGVELELDRTTSRLGVVNEGVAGVQEQLKVCRDLAAKLNAIRRMKEEHGIQD